MKSKLVLSILLLILTVLLVSCTKTTSPTPQPQLPVLEDMSLETLKRATCEQVQGDCLPYGITTSSGQMYGMSYTCTDETLCVITDTRTGVTLTQAYAQLANLMYFGILEINPETLTMQETNEAYMFTSGILELHMDKETGIINCLKDETGTLVCGEYFITYYQNSLFFEGDGELRCTLLVGDGECSQEAIAAYQELKTRII